MIQVRNGIFETNSSSVHAISIYTKLPKTIPDHIDLHCGEYGWEMDTYPLPDYIFTACACLDRADELADMLDKIGVTYTMIPSLRMIEREHSEGGYLPCKHGYIDHAHDLHSLLDILFSDEELFKCAMFNPASQVETGNDNSEEYPDPICGNDWYTFEKGN